MTYKIELIDGVEYEVIGKGDELLAEMDRVIAEYGEPQNEEQEEELGYLKVDRSILVDEIAQSEDGIVRRIVDNTIYDRVAFQEQVDKYTGLKDSLEEQLSVLNDYSDPVERTKREDLEFEIRALKGTIRAKQAMIDMIDAGEVKSR